MKRTEQTDGRYILETMLTSLHCPDRISTVCLRGPSLSIYKRERRPVSSIHSTDSCVSYEARKLFAFLKNLERSYNYRASF